MDLLSSVKVTLDEIKPPARLAKSIYREDNSTIFARGTLLYERQLLVLKKLGIDQIYIEISDDKSEKPFFLEIDEAYREIKALLKRGGSLDTISELNLYTLCGDSSVSKSRSEKSKTSALIQKKGDMPGNLVPIDFVEAGNVTVSSFYREKVQILASGTMLIPQYIEYLKKNRVREIWIEPKPRVVASDTSSETRKTVEEKSRIMARYDGNPETTMQIIGWLEEAVNREEFLLVHPIGHLAQYADFPLNYEALSALGRMKHPRAFEMLVIILSSGDPELFEPVIDVLRDTRDQKTLIARILQNLPSLEKELRDQLLQFLREFPEDIVRQVATSVAETSEQDIQLYCYAVINRIQSRHRLASLKHPDAFREEISNELDTEKLNTSKDGLLGKIDRQNIDVVKSHSRKILEYDPLTGSEAEVMDAIAALGGTRDSRSMSSLQYALDFFDINLKQEALRAIMQVYAPNQVRIVISALRFDDSTIEAMVRGFFAQKNDAYTISFLIRHLKDEGGVMRKRLIRLLACLPRERVMGVVEKLKQRGVEDVQEAAILLERALGRNNL